MTTEQPTPQLDWNEFNPAKMWRDWVVKSEAQWSESLGNLLKDERGGPMLKKQVDEARMMHRQFGEMAQAAMAAAYMPTRGDIEAIDERMGRLEDSLAQVSAQVVALREALVAQGAVEVARVPRTRRVPVDVPRTRRVPVDVPRTQRVPVDVPRTRRAPVDVPRTRVPPKASKKTKP